MKTIVHKLSSSAGLELHSLHANLDFAFYPDKDDFFLLLYCSIKEVLEMVGEDLQDLEYALNTLISEAKKNELLLNMNERNINYNLSLILFVEMDSHYPNMLQEFNKVEENYINAKKYILTYNTETLNQLVEKMNPEETVMHTLNTLVTTYSDAIQNTDDKWYELLLNLFIKIPFLNYETANPNLVITNLSNSIAESLSAHELEILNIINDTDISAISDIEKFAQNKNIL